MSYVNYRLIHNMIQIRKKKWRLLLRGCDRVLTDESGEVAVQQTCLTLIWTRHPSRCFLRHSPMGIGPRCSFQYDNGRVEECIKGEVVNDGMERIRVHMAKELAQWKASIQNKIS